MNLVLCCCQEPPSFEMWRKFDLRQQVAYYKAQPERALEREEKLKQESAELRAKPRLADDNSSRFPGEPSPQPSGGRSWG